jgi:putative acetyltransferase
MTVRREAAADLPHVRSVNEDAFGRPDEADLVDNLRAEGVVLCSLVAEEQGRVVGHILFTRMWIANIAAVALAPMSVLTGYQRRGIGGLLVRRGLDQLREQGERIVIVLGHPDYYPRFGFSVGKASGLESPFPAEAYMALELEPGALSGVRGKVGYPMAFGLTDQ